MLRGDVMPSPFPGMDPYLEHFDHWPGVHLELISCLRAALNRVIRPRYLATVEERVYLSHDPDDPRVLGILDVQLVETAPDAPGPVMQGDANTIQPVTLTWPGRIKVREPYVQIVDADSRDVVTVIEVVSPTNKRKGMPGRKSYMRKRSEVLRTPANWLEIDLQRLGDATFSRHRLPPCEYAVCSSPAVRRPEYLVWPIRIHQPLPTVSVPLRTPDPDVPLNLQAVFTEAYERGSLEGLVDYRQPPKPPLPPGWMAWADGLLRERGLR